MLQAGEASELVDSSDAAIVVAGLDESIRDHISMRAQLDLLDSEVNGYIFQRMREASWFARPLRDEVTARRAMSNDTPTW